MTSSIKPEVHNVLQRRHAEEGRATAVGNMRRNWHTTTANTALVQRRAVIKSFICRHETCISLSTVMRLSQALCSCHFKQQGCGLGLASVSTSASTSAPPCLSEHCIPVSSADARRHLRSANRHLLDVPRFRLNTYGRRAFSVAGPMAWNSLPVFIRDLTTSTDCFRRLLKTYLFARY